MVETHLICPETQKPHIVYVKTRPGGSFNLDKLPQNTQTKFHCRHCDKLFDLEITVNFPEPKKDDPNGS